MHHFSEAGPMTSSSLPAVTPYLADNWHIRCMSLPFLVQVAWSDLAKYSIVAWHNVHLLVASRGACWHHDSSAHHAFYLHTSHLQHRLDAM